MGLLPSQKYDFVLYEFCEYIIKNQLKIDENYKTIVDDYLKMKDDERGE